MNLTERNLQDAQKFLLMHEVVQPVVPVPFFMEDNVRFTHVAVDVVQGKDTLFHIIFLATGRLQLKMSRFFFFLSACHLFSFKSVLSPLIFFFETNKTSRRNGIQELIRRTSTVKKKEPTDRRLRRGIKAWSSDTILITLYLHMSSTCTGTHISLP